MSRPDRLVFFASCVRGENTVLEALFVHNGEPILFKAELPFEDREFFAAIHSTSWELAEEFDAGDLLDACWCDGCLEPEVSEKTEEVLRLIDLCDVESSENNLDV